MNIDPTDRHNHGRIRGPAFFDDFRQIVDNSTAGICSSGGPTGTIDFREAGDAGFPDSVVPEVVSRETPSTDGTRR